MTGVQPADEQERLRWGRAWARMRRRGWVVSGAFVLLLVVLALRWYGWKQDAVLVLTLLSWAALATWAEMCPCPKCGKGFFRKGLYHNGFARRCLHCGTAIGSQA